MRQSASRSKLLWMLIVVITPPFARADLPSPRLDRLTPLGGNAGSTVEVEIIGNDIDEVKSLLLDHPGLKAVLVKERFFRISIAADVPPGTYDVRLVGRFGVSNPRLFAVSHGLTDVAEKEPNDEPAQAQVVAVNSAINGTSDGNREDLFRFAAKKGQRIAIECQAAKLDSPLDATLTLTTAAGKQLASNGDYFGRDPFIDFVCPEDGDFIVHVHDLSFRGGFPYRLLIHDRPHIENLFPRAVQFGKAAEVSVFGRNLGGDAKPSTWRITDAPLEEWKTTITTPDALALGTYRFFDHPTDHSVLATAATCTLTGYQPQFRVGNAQVNGPPMLVTDIPVTVEVEPNDSPEKAQAITLSAVISGRFDKERDADWYEFTAAEDGQYSLDVYCERIAGRADPYLAVFDDKNNRMVELDDFGHRMNAFDGHLRDPSGMVGLNAKKKYRVLIQDRYRRGGARYQYVLAIRKARPDFQVAVIHHQNPNPGGTTIWRGGAALVDVIVHYQGGFNGPITLSAEGLPPGVHAAATTMSGTQGTFVFWSDASTAEWAGTVRLFATAAVGDRTIRREVRPYCRVIDQPATSRPTRELALAVRGKAPFALQFAQERIEIEAGKKATIPLRVERLWPEFTGKVSLQAAAPPGGIRVGAPEIAVGAAESAVTLDVQAGLRPGEYTLSMLGQAQVPFSKDSKAAAKPMNLVTMPARPITIVVVAAKK